MFCPHTGKSSILITLEVADRPGHIVFLGDGLVHREGCQGQLDSPSQVKGPLS